MWFLSHLALPGGEVAGPSAGGVQKGTIPLERVATDSISVRVGTPAGRAVLLHPAPSSPAGTAGRSPDGACGVQQLISQSRPDVMGKQVREHHDHGHLRLPTSRCTGPTKIARR